MRLRVVLTMPGDVKNLKEPVVQELADSLLERRWIDAGANGLAGKQIQFTGLQLTITDVLVRVEMLDGRTWTTIAHPSQPWVQIAASQTWLGVAGAYIVQGIRHILCGIDHLLFILGLMFIVKDRWICKDSDRVHCCTLDHARHRDARFRADARGAAERGDCVEHCVCWTGNCPLLARRNQLHDPAPMGRRVCLRVGPWFRFCQRIRKRWLAQERAAVGATDFQCRRRVRPGCFCHVDCVARTFFPATANPLATLGGGIARLRSRLGRRLLDDSTNSHLVGSDQVTSAL